MNKNPFLPTPSFTPQQPPLPPGPPPPQPSQPDYSAWWANAAAAHPHVQPPTVGPYNTQWTPPQPPRPPAEQSALYANYGYGSQNNHWQRQQQQQQQQQYHPPPPVIQQPPQPPTQPAYNPYQPSAGYPQQYVPQPGPPPQQSMAHPPYPHPPAQPQHFFPSPMPPQQPQQHQQPQQSQPRHIHHAPPQHLPPAKRQRFDGPNNNNRHHQNQPPQPQFQPPPAPPQNLGNFSGPSHGPNRGGVPSGPAGRGGGPAGPRGGGIGARGARGGSMSGNRGGLSGGRGRGGSFVGGGSGGRGGSGGGQTNGPLRGHGSRNNFGGGNKDFHNRRGGGSFTGSGGGAGYSHQGGSSFRGRNQGHMSSNRGNRPDGGGGSVFGSREGTMSSSFGGKKDENRRTLTDFKIIGLAIPGLSWTWGIIPSLSPVKAEGNVINVDGQGTSSTVVKEDILDDGSSMHAVASSNIAKETQIEIKSEVPVQSTEIEMTDAKPPQDTVSSPPPPSRIRIYFHTPVTADDSRPIPHNSSYGDIPSDSRKGKRKKLEDDDGDLEERRAPPPPPQMGSAMNDDQSSVTASVAETASEGDWLMAAIVEGEEAAGAVGDLPSEDDEESDQLHVSQIVKDDEPDDSIDDDVTVGDETFLDGNSHDDVHMTGAELEALESSAAFGTMDDNPRVAEAATANSLFSASSGQMSTLGRIHGGHITDPNAAADDSEQPNMVASDNIVTILPLAPEVHDSSVSASLISSSSQNDAVSAESADDYSADHPEYLETQVFEASSQKLGSKSLESVSDEPTLLNMDEATQPDESAFNNLNGVEPFDHQTTNDASDLAGTASHGDHLPEPPASPSDDASSLPLVKVDAGVAKTPSANRLSISYSRGNRRFVVDAEVVESVKLFRQEGHIEVTINVDKNIDGSLKGILMEGLSDATKSYSPLVTDLEGSTTPDITVPPFSKVPVPSSLKLFVYLDTARPLSEPKWAKTGDVQDWLKSMFGRMFWVAGDAAEGWEKKIHVVDPDPPPTIWTVLDGWSTNSPVGVPNERQRFLKTHMTETDNILEILLRLVRGERATPFSQSAPAISAPSVSGPLLSALSQGSAHGAQQTHVSLAVLAMFRLTVDYAKKALGDKGKGDAEERMGEIIRYLPSHLIYKSLDGIFKEWRSRVTSFIEERVSFDFIPSTALLRTMFRNTYDSDNTVFSPQGRLHQVEYALEAVKQGSAAVGLRSKTHSVLLALKRSTGELASYQQKMFRIDDHVGIAIAGLTSDARVLSNFMRQQAMSSKMIFNRPIPVNRLVSSIADKAQVNTQEYGRRPYGVGFLVIGQDNSGPHLYEFSPSGNSYEYYAMSIGARSQSAKTYLEKHYESFADCSLEDLVRHGLHALRETLQQDKELNVNNTSVGIVGPPSEHEKVATPGGSFRILENESVGPFLKTMIPKASTESSTTTATTDEDVQMTG
ncbi:hypothetical protein BYT27DRAFT_7340602 [Phlegmacium glaucopus]|nr:hypothetical protein BYT27DRAFT_7340602 [Phlegmacium glaucopus]